MKEFSTFSDEGQSPYRVQRFGLKKKSFNESITVQNL